MDRDATAAPTLYLTCGLPGSGKTTRAREIEAASDVVRLGADEWIRALYPEDAEVAARDERRDHVETLQWQLAEQLLRAGTSVVLDWGLWTRTERDSYRDRATEVGAIVRLEFTDAPLDVLKQRVERRNADLPPGTFHISTAEMDEFAGVFEPPAPDELETSERTG